MKEEIKKRKKRHKGYRKVEGHVSLCTDPKTRQKLDYIADQEKESVSTIVRHWIAQGIEHYQRTSSLSYIKDMKIDRRRVGQKRVFTTLED